MAGSRGLRAWGTCFRGADSSLLPIVFPDGQNLLIDTCRCGSYARRLLIRWRLRGPVMGAGEGLSRRGFVQGAALTSAALIVGAPGSASADPDVSGDVRT